MAKLTPGIWTLGDLTILSISDELHFVGMSHDAAKIDFEHTAKVLREMFPDGQFYLTKGIVSYQTLAESVDLNKLIEDKMKSTMQELMGAIRNG
jgi:hypothetical protein